MYLNGFSQISDADLNKLKSQVESEAIALKAKLKSNSSNDVLLEFQIDTFKIESLLDKRIDLYDSTLGMINATNDAAKEYDELLNKYYQKLLSILDDKDKPILQDAQRNWIKFRDSEFKLINLLSDDRYSGGGTIQRIIRSAKYMDVTKTRVIELVNHLPRN